MKKKRYRSDLTDNQWKLIEPILPGESPLGRPRTTELREVMNALRYMSRTGCQWEMLPSEFPARSTVFDYFKLWRDEGILDEIVVTLRESIRIKAGRNCEPSAAIIDSQSVKTTGSADDVGYDSGKKIKGRKRHLAVDVLGLLLMVVVHSAGIQDRAGATLLGAQAPIACGWVNVWLMPLECPPTRWNCPHPHSLALQQIDSWWLISFPWLRLALL